MDIYRFIGFVYPEYNAWYKNYLNGMLSGHGFDAFTFAEIMYPIYDGPEKNPPFYGDVSPGFQAAFKRATGSETFPNFTDPADPDYFRTNTGLYRQLVEYRVRTIDDFYDDIINGPGGAREAAPGILFATWTLGINIPDGVAKLREWEGNDIVAMIRRVKPDLHFIQTHAPDWANPALPGDYPLAYQPFFDAVRTANPDVKIGMQADLGSLGPSRRDPAWQKQFYDACRKAGVDTTTYYEFGLRWEIYSQPPRLCEIRRDGDTLLLVFDQRLNAESAMLMKGRELRGKDRSYRIAECRWDGNLLRLKPDALPAGRRGTDRSGRRRGGRPGGALPGLQPGADAAGTGQHDPLRNRNDAAGSREFFRQSGALTGFPPLPRTKTRNRGRNGLAFSVRPDYIARQQQRRRQR